MSSVNPSVWRSAHFTCWPLPRRRLSNPAPHSIWRTSPTSPTRRPASLGEAAETHVSRSLAAHANQGVILLQQFRVLIRGVLHAAIGMMHQAGRWLPLVERHLQRRYGQLGLQLPAQSPADHAPRERVQHHGQIHEFRPGNWGRRGGSGFFRLGSTHVLAVRTKRPQAPKGSPIRQRDHPHRGSRLLGKTGAGWCRVRLFGEDCRSARTSDGSAASIRSTKAPGCSTRSSATARNAGSAPVVPVQAPILHRFSHVLGGDPLGAAEVGDRPCDF